jgi:hypothetical protein
VPSVAAVPAAARADPPPPLPDLALKPLPESFRRAAGPAAGDTAPPATFRAVGGAGSVTVIVQR